MHNELFQLSIDDAGSYNCKVRLINNYPADDSELWILGEDYIHINSSIVTGEQLCNAKDRAKIIQLEETQKVLFLESIYDLTCSLAGAKGAAGGKLLKSIAKMEWGDSLESAMGFPYSDFCESGSYSGDMEAGTGSMAAIISSISNYHALLKEMEGIRSDMRNRIFSQGICVQFELAHDTACGMVSYSRSEMQEEMLVGEGIILGRALVNQQIVNEEGLEGYLKRQGCTDEEIEIIQGGMGNLVLVNEELVGLINGNAENRNSWYNADPAEVSALVADIDKWFDSNGHEHLDFAAWLRGE